MTNLALGIIDAQRGFMPAHEGQRLNQEGFGELPVPGGEQIVPKLNTLLAACAERAIASFTTQDFHPAQTAHFAAQPNYQTTWPVHCVGGTPGADLHPELTLNASTQTFYKGSEVLQDGADDTSYSGYNARRFEDNKALPQWLVEREIKAVALGGLALDYCVRATALDLKQRMGLTVTILSDATAPVSPETARMAIAELEAAGIKFATTAELLEQLNNAAS